MAEVALSYSGMSAGDEKMGVGGGVKSGEEENIVMCRGCCVWKGLFFSEILAAGGNSSSRHGRLYTSLPPPLSFFHSGETSLSIKSENPPTRINHNPLKR